jgi:hypothetical protein
LLEGFDVFEVRGYCRATRRGGISEEAGTVPLLVRAMLGVEPRYRAIVCQTLVRCLQTPSRLLLFAPTVELEP